MRSSAVKKQRMPDTIIQWPELESGTLIRRYKRFLADIELPSGGTITVHCPNSGRMLECSQPGCRVLMSRSSNPARKLIHTWEIIEMPSSPVVVNTLRANEAASSAVRKGLIPELAGYSEVRKEVPWGKKSRLDLLLSGEGVQKCFVEVKSCTYVQDGTAMFPDAVSSRGLKHLVDLQEVLAQGCRSVLLILIQRMDAHQFRPADHIDPRWGSELRKAYAGGIEVLIYSTSITASGMAMGCRVPLSLA